MTRAAIAAAAALAAMLGAASAEALSPDAIAQTLTTRFAIKVLQVKPIERDGKSLYAVAVMNPGGNFNEAFAVTTLIVDPQSGELVAQFRSEPSGYALPAAPNRSPPADSGGPAIRRETFRGR